MQEGDNKTIVEIKSFAEADAVLREAFPDYQKIRGSGGKPQEKEIKQIRKKTQLDRNKKDWAYHEDYIMNENKIVYGHENGSHGNYPHINIKCKDGKTVLINIVLKKR